MHDTDDLTTLTDFELAKWHEEAMGALPKYTILAENEWRMRSIRKQDELNKFLMREQHKLNRYLVIITAIATLVAAILGGVIQRYGPNITYFSQTEIHNETQLYKKSSTKVTTPLKKLDISATTRKDISSKGHPIKVK